MVLALGALTITGLPLSPAWASSGSGGGTEGSYALVQGEHGQTCLTARQIIYESGPDYRGTYKDPASGLIYKGRLKATARWSSYESPDGSFADSDCKVPSRHPTTATVEGNEPDPDSGAARVSCLYRPEDGSTYGRTGATVTEELSGTCTLVSRDGKPHLSRTHEQRRRVLQRTPALDESGRPRPACDGMPPKQCWTVDSYTASDLAPGSAPPAAPSRGAQTGPAMAGANQAGAPPTAPTNAPVPPPAASPFISRLDPSSGPVEGKRVVTVTGGAFVGVIRVLFGETAVSQRCGLPTSTPGPCFHEVSATELRVVSPPAQLGRVHVAVETPQGMSPKTDAALFEYLTVTPVSRSTGLVDRIGPAQLLLLAIALLAAAILVRRLVSPRPPVSGPATSR